MRCAPRCGRPKRSSRAWAPCARRPGWPTGHEYVLRPATRAGSPGTSTSCAWLPGLAHRARVRRALGFPGWHTGHQYVVRPPIVARARPVRQRGHAPSRRRSGMRSPVCAPPLRIADRTAARSARRSPSSCSADSSPAGSRGESRARHRISSASRLPIPAITPWSSSRAFNGAVPRPTRARNVSRPTSAASGPTWAKSGSSSARPSRRLSCSASRPPPANSIAKRSQLPGAGGASTSIRPDIPRCSPSTGPVDSTQRNLPRRCVRTSAWLIRAPAISPGACGRQTYVSRSSTATTSRPSTRSICCRARSASGSSGMRRGG